jgi:hypothetical protein
VHRQRGRRVKSAGYTDHIINYRQGRFEPGCARSPPKRASMSCLSMSGRRPRRRQLRRCEAGWGGSLRRGLSSGFEPVSAETQPVSGRSRAQISDIENSSSRDGCRNLRPLVRDVRYSSPETGPFTANPRECRHSSEHRKRQARDHYGWLGRQDSNLGMSESNPWRQC